MKLTDKDQDSDKDLNIRDVGGGIKRPNDEEFEGETGESSRSKKIRISEDLSEALGKLHVNDEEGSEPRAFDVEVKEDPDLIRSRADFGFGFEFGFDLNVEIEDLHNASVSAEAKLEVISVSSGNSRDDVAEIIDVDSLTGNHKEIEEVDANDKAGSSSVLEFAETGAVNSGATRLSREDKGKTPVSESVYPSLLHQGNTQFLSLNSQASSSVNPWVNLGNSSQFPPLNSQASGSVIRGVNLGNSQSPSLNSQASSSVNPGVNLGNSQFPPLNSQASSSVNPGVNLRNSQFPPSNSQASGSVIHGVNLGNNQFPPLNPPPRTRLTLGYASNPPPRTRLTLGYASNPQHIGTYYPGLTVHTQIRNPQVPPLPREDYRGCEMLLAASTLLEQAFNGSNNQGIPNAQVGGSNSSSSVPRMVVVPNPYQRPILQPFRPPIIMPNGRYAPYYGHPYGNLVNVPIYVEESRRALEQYRRGMTEEFKKSREMQQNVIPARVEGELGSLKGSFSDALKRIRQINSNNKNAQELIDWKPASNIENRPKSHSIPSLFDLSVGVLTKNVEGLVSLDHVPNIIRRKLTNALCDDRKMNSHILDLLLQGYLPELHIKDCSWLPDTQFVKSFANLDTTDLRVLQLDLCGQIAFEYALPDTFGKSENSLPKLAIISLKGAARLTDKAIEILLKSAPKLLSMNLSQCSLVTETGIKHIANALGPVLRELYMDECPRLDAMLIIQAIRQFKNLEVLSVAGVQGVCDSFVKEIVTANIKELNLADCPKLTNYALELIGSTCVDLRALNISNAENLTDKGLEYLANKCTSLETLKLGSNRFSDEAVAAFLEVSGQNLKDLSLNKISKVAHNTAISLARTSKSLINLDLSWCRRISNEGLGLIVDSCLSLKLLKVFGCSQINSVFLDGYSNPLVKIVGLRNTPILDNLKILEPEETLLRYSALPNEFLE